MHFWIECGVRTLVFIEMQISSTLINSSSETSKTGMLIIKRHVVIGKALTTRLLANKMRINL